MDYKEKYEMALEGIQEILGSGEDSIKMSRLQLRLQGIFPELKESEDERIRKSIIELLNEVHFTFKYYDIKKMLAWLEKQGEQKSAWSEDDEKMWSQVINEIETIKSNSSTVFEKNIAQDKIDFLKSLKDRYAWKPSDAQMASITCAVRKMKESACYDSELVSLYQDLKKL